MKLNWKYFEEINDPDDYEDEYWLAEYILNPIKFYSVYVYRAHSSAYYFKIVYKINGVKLSSELSNDYTQLKNAKRGAERILNKIVREDL